MTSPYFPFPFSLFPFSEYEVQILWNPLLPLLFLSLSYMILQLNLYRRIVWYVHIYDSRLSLVYLYLYFLYPRAFFHPCVFVVWYPILFLTLSLCFFVSLSLSLLQAFGFFRHSTRWVCFTVLVRICSDLQCQLVTRHFVVNIWRWLNERLGFGS